MKQLNFTQILLLSLLVLIASSLIVEAQDCYPTGQVTGTRPPNDQCNRENDSQCCEEGKPYDIYRCSPSVSGQTKATLTINSFQEGGDGGGASACDGNFHDDNTPVVALSTGWFNGRSRCLKFININGNGRSVRAQVVDECDSTTGCDEEHSYQPPCQNNIVDASRAVWSALGLDENDDRWGYMDVTWSDA